MGYLRRNSTGGAPRSSLLCALLVFTLAQPTSVDRAIAQGSIDADRRSHDREHTSMDEAWTATGWSKQFAPLGIVGTAYSIVEYQGDIVVGGNFFSAGGIDVEGVARWIGDRFTDLSRGLTNTPRALLNFNDRLYASGRFLGVQRALARLDGDSWTYLDDAPGSDLFGMVGFRNQLVVRGRLVTANEVLKLARWTGSTLEPLAPALLRENGAEAGTAEAFLVWRNDLVVGGSFSTSVSGASLRNIARWDGESWHPLAEGLEHKVVALETFRGRLIAMVDPSPPGPSVLWEYDGHRWRAFGPERTITPRALGVDAGRLYASHVTGTFEAPGSWLEIWDGRNWTLSGQITGTVYDFLKHRGKWIAVGHLYGSPEREHNGVMVHDRGDWVALGRTQTVSEPVHCAILWSDRVLVGGDFRYAGGRRADGLALLDANGAKPFGDHPFESVYQLDASGETLVALGRTREATRQVAILRDSEWSLLQDFDLSEANQVAMWNDRPIVAGRFRVDAPYDNSVALWDGEGFRRVGAPFHGYVSSLAVFDGNVFAAGEFASVGDVSTGPVAVWTGNDWESAGIESLDLQAVGMLKVADLEGGEVLFASGRGSSIPGWRLATFDAGGWGLLPDVFDRQVFDVAASGHLLAAGGGFGRVGGVWMGPMAIWDGQTWQAPGGEGISLAATVQGGAVESVVAFGGGFVAAGLFGYADGVPSRYLARWRPEPTATTSQGVTASPVASTSNALRLRWRGPANGGQAAFELSLPNSGPVTLEVFDVRGRSVSSIETRSLGAGVHLIPWSGRDHAHRSVARGTYFVRATSGGEEARVKFQWLR